jgi:hypothetical protein
MDDGICIAAYRTIFSMPGLDRYAMQAVPPIHTEHSKAFVARNRRFERP